MDEISGTEVDNTVSEGIALGEKAKEKVASDPDAVRKIVANQLSNYVTDDVTVYPDKGANLAFAKYQQRVAEISGRIPKKFHNESDEEYTERTKEFKAELEALEAEGESIRQAVRDSGVTFRFIGIGKKAVKRIRAEVRKEYPLPVGDERDDPDVAEERQDAFEHRIIAAHLAHAGYTAEDVASFRDAWPNKAFADLWATAMRLSIADDYLIGAIDADF